MSKKKESQIMGSEDREAKIIYERGAGIAAEQPCSLRDARRHCCRRQQKLGRKVGKTRSFAVLRMTRSFAVLRTTSKTTKPDLSVELLLFLVAGAGFEPAAFGL